MARTSFRQRDRFMGEARTLYDNGGDARRVVQLIKLAWAAHRLEMRKGRQPERTATWGAPRRRPELSLGF